MFSPHTLFRRLGSHAAQGWRRVRLGYRIANRVSHHALGMLMTGVVVLYFIFCALVLGLRFVVLPNIDHYKPNVEQLASRLLQRQVSVQTIHASWRGLNPQLQLDEVVVRNRRGETALRLPQVSATLSWTSLLVADLRLDSLVIDRPDLEIERDADGKLYVAGVAIEPGGDDGRGLDWLLSQREIRVREGWVRWRDGMRDAAPLTLEHVGFLMRNQWRHHRFALKATPPQALGAPLDLRADFRHPSFAKRISDISRWSGTVYADWRDTDLEKWRAWVDYPFEVRRGNGELRAWVGFDNARVVGVTADLGLSGLWLRLRPELEPLDIRRISGRIAAKIAPDAENDAEPLTAQSVSLTDLTMETEDGQRLPSTTISASRVPGAGGAQRTEIAAAYVELAPIADFLGKLPLSGELHAALTDFAPRGVLRDFAAGWQGEYPRLSGWHLKGRFDALSLRPRGAQSAQAATPGFDNLAGAIDANERGGSIRLAAPGAVLHLPGYLVDPELPFEQLQLQANWSRPKAHALQVQLGQLAFVQDGVAGEVHGSWQGALSESGHPSPGVANLSASVPNFDLRRIGRFLPMALPQSTREWLVGALQAGQASEVAMVLKGDLAQFPFQEAHARTHGQFSVSGKLDGGRLNYTPGKFAENSTAAPMWPLLDDIHGSFSFERARMEIRGDSAKTSGVSLSKVEAVIPDLLSHDPQLNIRGQGLGPLQDYLRFVADSPVAEWIGNFTDEANGSGDARLNLRLGLPLAHVRDAKVDGSLQFLGNDVKLLADLPLLSRASGELKFSERGFALNGMRAGFLGGMSQISGGTQKDGTSQVRAEGAISADGLRAAYPQPALKRVLARLNGGSRYSAQINIRGRQPEILVDSSLQGLALDLPAPFRKSAAETLPLRFAQTIAPATSGEMRQDWLLALGKTLEARYQRRRPDAAHAEWQLVRGGIGVNAPPPVPEAGVGANIRVDSLNLDAWRALGESGSGNAGSGNTGSSGAAGSLDAYLDPRIVALRASEVIVMGKKLDGVIVGASRSGGAWQANVESAQASGHLSFNAADAGPGRITARLATLIVPESATSDVSDLLRGKDTTTQLPALDVVAERFELSGRQLGRLQLVADNVEMRAGREWRIAKLALANPDGVFNASGKWTIDHGASVSSLDYTLDIDNAGKLLERFGYAHVLKAGKGHMSGKLRWDGLPFKMDMASLSGDMQLDIASGQFLKVDPGAAKLLGVLSLQSLPRRLTLDFRDVFSEGFAFDGVVASASINHGVMKTDSFKMRGVSAVVLLDGAVDIARETQDLTVVVLPEINAGAASVAYGLMVNPVVGLGTFLAQLFLRDPLMHAFTMEYHIAGSWKDPEISKVNRNAGKSGPVAANPPDQQGKPR